MTSTVARHQTNQVINQGSGSSKRAVTRQLVNLGVVEQMPRRASNHSHQGLSSNAMRNLLLEWN